METVRQVHATRGITAPAALFAGSSALFAAATAWLLWTYLPYVRFARYTAAERFALWEGFVWLIALVLGFLGLAAVLQVVGWNLPAGAAELRRRLRGPGSDHPLVSAAAVLAWWMIACAIALVVIATAARSLSGV